MKIAVASGKGGTGKTTVSVNLAAAMARDGTPSLQIIDCDVEEPNVHLFLQDSVADIQVVNVLVPEIDRDRCDGCGKCSDFCAFNAIVSIGTSAMAFAQMCHSCGGCKVVCPKSAITEVPRRIGQTESFTVSGFEVISGRLDVGMAMAPPLIRRVKALARPDATVIIDAPPGASCPAVATVRDCDGVLLVTEPTPFGLHDLEKAILAFADLDVPMGVIINRSGSGDNRVDKFCRSAGLPVLLKIPDDRRVATAYSRGELAIDAIPEYLDIFKRLASTIPGGLKRPAAISD